MKVHRILFESRVGTLEITRIRIDGFKNIVNAEIKLDKITSLLSVNSYGKSNLLQAIDFGFFFINASPNKKKKMMCWIGGFPLNEEYLTDIFSFEMQGMIEADNKKYDVIFEYSFMWGKPDKTSGIVSETLRIKNLDDSQKHSLYISRDKEKCLYKSSLSGRCDKEIKIGDNELLINKLMAFDNLFYLNIIKVLNNIYIYIDRHFDSNPSYELPFLYINSDELSLSDNKDIPRVLYFLKEQHPEKYELIINTLMDIFSFIEKIEIEVYPLEYRGSMQQIASENELFKLADKKYVLYAKHKNLVTPINFLQFSDGVKRVLLLLTYLVLAEINNYPLIAIEEPENSINPGLLKKYIIALDNFVDRTKVLITSHSPFLVNYIDPSSLYLGVPNEKGLAIFRKVKSSSVSKIYHAADDSNVLVGEYLFDLMSSDKDDGVILEKYLEHE